VDHTDILLQLDHQDFLENLKVQELQAREEREAAGKKLTFTPE
jgi:hypothetical protein